MEAPDEPYHAFDPRFRRLVLPNARPETLFADCRWAEGPVWLADSGILLWSDIPNDRMLRWAEGGGTTVFRAPAGHANGNARDREGRLVTCEHGGRRVVRTEPDGRLVVLADRHAGGRLNSPNDVVVKSDGTIWFTDPTYGIMSDYEGHRAPPEQAGSFVFRIDPATGALAVMADDFVQPNGIAFSPDERVLYVSDTGRSHDPDGPHHIRAFDVARNGRLSGARVFAEVSPGVPDGFRVDTGGNVWSSAGDGVRVFSPAGEPLGRIALAGATSNLAFGGPRRNRLFVTAGARLEAVFVAATGAQRP